MTTPEQHQIHNPHWRIWKAADALDISSSSEDVEKSSLLLQDPNESNKHNYAPLASITSKILSSWARRWNTPQHSNKSSVRSLLNKPSLLHEVEESIVAIDSLLRWIDATNNDDHETRMMITVVDLCCGKGIFSMLLSHLASEAEQHSKNDHADATISRWVRPLKRCCIRRIVMVDKTIPSKDVDWGHVDWVNADVEQRKKCLCSLTLTSPDSNVATNEDDDVCSCHKLASIPIEAWGGCNIHDDSFTLRIKSLTGEHDSKIALIGIHLCKTLSPRAISIFNILGPSLCPFLCLAPCCLPRFRSNAPSTPTKQQSQNRTHSSSSITINLYETPQQQKSRQCQTELRNNALGKHRLRTCYLCQGSHRVRECPSLSHVAKNENERIAILKQAAASAPCWKCGRYGHVKADCPSVQKSTKPTLVLAPFVDVDISCIFQGISGSDDGPFVRYCFLLAHTVQVSREDDVSSKIRNYCGFTDDSIEHLELESKKARVRIVDAPLSQERGGARGHGGGKNWNGSRKTRFIEVWR